MLPGEYASIRHLPGWWFPDLSKHQEHLERQHWHSTQAFNTVLDQAVPTSLLGMDKLHRVEGREGLGSSARTKGGRSKEWTGKDQYGETLGTGGQRLVFTEHNQHQKAELDKPCECQV